MLKVKIEKKKKKNKKNFDFFNILKNLFKKKIKK